MTKDERLLALDKIGKGLILLTSILENEYVLAALNEQSLQPSMSAIHELALDFVRLKESIQKDEDKHDRN